jgi:two-component system, LuxR family, response regulator FixJ
MSGYPQHAPGTTTRTVVVVDDDPRIRQSLESLLISAGFDVRLFGSGAEVLQSGALAAAECLITDIRMPGIDGWELHRRTQSAYPQLPLIFVTSHQDEDAFRRALSGGAFAFLYKPFDGEELLSTVEAACNTNENDTGNGLASL